MARHFLVSTLKIHIYSPTIWSIISILAIISLVGILCASHKRQNKSLKKRKYLALSFTKGNNISSKALLKMVSWRKQVQHGDDDDDDDDDDHHHHHGCYGCDDEDENDDVVWKKTIIMGEKCKPLDFSGKIEYDYEGNLLPVDKNRLGDDQKSNVDSTIEVVVS